MMTTSKRTRRACDTSTASLDELIAAKRDVLVSAREEVPVLREQARALRVQADGMTRRWETRSRGDLLRRAATLDAEADERASMRREHEFERNVVAYLRAYHQHETVPKVNETRKSDVIREYARKSDACALHKTSIVDEYVADVEGATTAVAMSARDECPKCDVKLLLCTSRSIMTCPKCGYAVTYLDITSSTTPFDEVVEYSQYSYKRVNHYMMHITLVQGREAHRVDDESLARVMHDLYHRQHVRKVEDITQRRVRETLRHLKLRKAYDHVAQVTARISGIPAPRVSKQVEDKLRNMFLQMQPAFARHAPKTRSNFLSYSYVLYRSFQILGLHEMCEGITLLRGRDKLEANDAIFRKMSEDLGWPVFDLPPASETVG